jgi:uncharacterized protein (TIGR02996 family)
MSDSPYLRAICEAPFDDGPRLVYADALDERGEAARAEFIRVQCELAKLPHGDHCLPDNHCVHCPDPPRHETLRRRERELLLSPPPGSAYSRAEFWTPAVLRSGAVACEVSTQPPTFRSLQSGMAWGFRRGLVGSVTLAAAQFFGGPCESCGGRGYTLPSADSFLIERKGCSACGGDGWKDGTGRVEGLAAALFAAAPVTEVRLSDKRPDTVGDSWCWWRPSEACADYHHLPHEVCDLLPGEGGFLYDTEADALSALSAACVAVGRARAELPALARVVGPAADGPHLSNPLDPDTVMDDLTHREPGPRPERHGL